MIAALLILLPVVAAVTWAFFRFGPRHADRKTAARFNLGSVVLAFALAGAWCLRTYLVITPTVDSAWWPIISALGALMIFPLVLGAAAVLRNLVIFRRSKERSLR